MNSTSNAHHKNPTALLVLTALGIVYGDIGTSPLYAIRESFLHTPEIALNTENIIGVLSLVFWALIIVISIKYVEFILRADNHGEGGVLALTALACLQKGHRRLLARRAFLILGLFGTALLVGDGMITPAISVLSAVEGLKVATPELAKIVIPLTTIILIGLFYIQKKGTSLIGKFFGPVMLAWFFVIGSLGISSILQTPEILQAVNPMNAIHFFMNNGKFGFIALGSVFLVTTGGEALFADMGHLGREAIRRGWFFVALPGLMLNYFGQGALLLRNPLAIDNPFYRLAPDWALYPLVALATMATIIASQALITGLFSFASQSIQLGYLPRMEVIHTSDEHMGQIYVPQINWITLIGTLVLVFEFGSSSSLAAAYGISVSFTMVATTALACVVAYEHWDWKLSRVLPIAIAFLVIDLAFAGANSLKIADGGWVPLTMAAITFVLMTTWKQGRKVLYDRLRKKSYPFTRLIEEIKTNKPARVKGTAIFMVGDSELTPPTLIHNLKHNKVLHETIVFLTVVGREISHVPKDKQITVTELTEGIFRVVVTIGFRQSPSVMDILHRCEVHGHGFKLEEPTFFLGREIIVVGQGTEMPYWRKKLFSAMARNSTSANSYFNLPIDRVIEVGMQVEL
jgi:KUP system potassium uptake protein